MSQPSNRRIPSDGLRFSLPSLRRWAHREFENPSGLPDGLASPLIFIHHRLCSVGRTPHSALRAIHPPDGLAMPCRVYHSFQSLLCMLPPPSSRMQSIASLQESTYRIRLIHLVELNSSTPQPEPQPQPPPRGKPP